MEFEQDTHTYNELSNKETIAVPASSGETPNLAFKVLDASQSIRHDEQWPPFLTTINSIVEGVSRYSFVNVSSPTLNATD